MKVKLGRYLRDVVNQNIVHRDDLSSQMDRSLQYMHVRKALCDAVPDDLAVRVHDDFGDVGTLGQPFQDMFV